MTNEQTIQSFEDLIKSLEENGVGDDAPVDNAFSLFGNNITDLTPANFYAAFGDSDTLTANNGVYRIIRNVDGSVRALNYTDNWGQITQVETLESQLNSNASAPTYDPTTTFTYTQSTNIIPDSVDPSKVNLTGGVSKYVDNVLQSQKRVTAAGVLSAAPFAAGLGVRLGKAIDAGLYKALEAIGADPPEELNPETWAQVAQQDDFAGWVFRTLFDIQPASVTQYVDAEAVAYMSLWLKNQGFFETGGSASYDIDDTTGLNMRNITLPVNVLPGDTVISTYVPSSYTEMYKITSGSAIIVPIRTASGDVSIMAISNTDFRISSLSESGVITRTWIPAPRPFTIRGETSTYYTSPAGNATFTNNYITNLPDPTVFYPYDLETLSYIIIFGTRSEPSPVPGISNNGYPVPDVSTWADPATTLTSLQQQYPDWWNNRLEETVTQPDGTTRTYTYVPFTLPNEQSDGNPDTQTNDPDELEVETETATQTKLQTIIELLTDRSTNTLVDPTTSTQTGTNDNNPTSEPNPPDTGTGEGLPFVVPTGNASSLWAVYHPSQSQLNAFGAWLWSSDFVEQLKRLFNDPMQAIIGVHKVFAPIPTGGSSTIKCGFLDSGVSSPTVSSQYTEVDCGSVSCSEYFGSVFDYDPHTKVSIYLPFIGVVPLKVSEVMRSTISVTYGVDVITGACLAKVRVSRDNAGGILYSYGGSCACHYPISSGSYAGIISGIVTSALGVAGGIMSGNPLSAIGGAVAGLRQAHTDVQRSGGFTGCAGAMGPKKPYLIIDRPQTRMAAEVEKYSGKPSNATQFIGDCTGFIRAKEVHFSAPGAFDEEAREIENLLKSGVLMSD